MPVSYHCQVLQTGDLILLSGDAQQGAGDLLVFGHRCIRDSLGERCVGVGVGRLDERSHKCLGGLGGLGACCPRGDINRVDDPFQSV